MKDTLPFLKTMLAAPGLSGYERPILEIIQKEWELLTEEISVSRLGSLHALKKGDAPEPRRKILLSAHMDAIGLMVTGIKDDLIRFTEVGGIDSRILPGQLVTVHGRKDLPGMVVQPPEYLLPEGVAKGPVHMQYLYIDTGLRSDEVAENVRVGDVISFAQAPLELSGETLAGHTLDNRVSVTAVTICLEILKRRLHSWDVWALASTQEEETLGGAMTSSFEIKPDLAVVIDVTWAKGPGGDDWRSFPMGKGLTIVSGPNMHPVYVKKITTKADELEIPYHQEMAPRMSGTDAMAIQIVQEGIPCIVLGIPLRYMHTPVEMVSLKDIKRVGRLMAEFICDLAPDFTDTIKWED
ncbi:MAG: hypothetical protein MUO40_01065 [Anaerolineaceae bacterium]|nr:hypothetical protein [Anaerolineaceae bacterium]